MTHMEAGDAGTGAGSTDRAAPRADATTPVYYARELAERIPAARLRVLERGGHSMLSQYPEAGAEALLAFLTLPTGDPIAIRRVALRMGR